ncbi:hypothetical protein [Aquibium microcysteis]|uniref:hypothetical protein n=1 Tax=Aquibium microcysteis TaxID=675281 RepID=UPI00165D2901|nr:hypothetical protein [Aquibium microcysteis]
MSSTKVCRHISPSRALPIVACAALLALGGCSAMSIEDAVPVAAQAAPTDTIGTGPSAPRQTGQFPNLNVPARAATEQFSDAEASATTSELLLAQQRAKRTVASLSRPGAGERLRVLGNNRGADVISEIEGR